MRTRTWMIAATLAAGALPWAACGTEKGGTGGGSDTAAATSSAGAAGNTACIGIFPPGACADCLTASCCGALADCFDDPAASCLDCATGDTSGPMCTDSPTGALIAAFQTCLDTHCAAQCPPPSPPPPPPACDAPAAAPSMGACYAAPAGGCNPVTNAGCDAAAGESCDVAENGFQCYAPPPPNTVAICAACNSNLECGPGSTCVGAGSCARYCCDDGDCGSGRCDKTTIGDPSVGVCLTAPAGGAPTDAGDGG